MTQSVWKFPLQIAETTVLTMPRNAVILHVGEQHGAPQMWALVNRAAVSEERRFITVGTGNVVPESISAFYIGTYQLLGGDIVFHVFEDKK